VKVLGSLPGNIREIVIKRAFFAIICRIGKDLVESILQRRRSL
jgi:hypothetical protein